MSKRGDRESLQDIREAISRIRAYCEGTDYEGFLGDTKTQDAVIRNLEIIGEATKNVSADLKRTRPEVEWKKIAGMRDKIIHFYFGVNWDIVWQVLQEEVPDLAVKVDAILTGTDNSPTPT